jgi:hypothetical protein
MNTEIHIKRNDDGDLESAFEGDCVLLLGMLAVAKHDVLRKLDEEDEKLSNNLAAKSLIENESDCKSIPTAEPLSS